MTPTPAIFALLLLASFSFFIWSCLRRFSLLTLGAPENRLDRLPERLKSMLMYAFGQKRVLARPFGLNHFFIFWSFIMLLAANAEFMVKGIFPGVGFNLLPIQIQRPLLLLLDIASAIALVAVATAAARRIISPPYPEGKTPEAFAILSLIASLMLAYFFMNGTEIVLLPPDEFRAAQSWMPFSYLFSKFIAPASSAFVHDAAWWVHATALLAFICYLPHSKHMHILTAIPNCFFRALEKPNTQPREEFEPGKVFGVSEVVQFTWKELLDSFSCTECGRCQQACPATNTGKGLNPRKVIHSIKTNLIKNGDHFGKGEKPATPLIGEDEDSGISESAIWGCTTCGACMESCPVFIEHIPKLVKLRRHLVENEAKFPEELLNLFENMEARSNPWGIAPSERTKWSSQLEIRAFDSETTDYLYFVGCAGSFDSRNKQISVAMAQILDMAGISWGVLGKEEKCCGDSLRRLGNEYVFDKMVKENVALFRERKVTKIITHCPHCFSTLKNDYRQYGFDAEVIHHSEMLHQILASGRVKIDNVTSDSGRIAFHDSCYLARHNDIADEPRSVIEKAAGAPPHEMRRNRKDSFCCGAGGGRMWMEEHEGERININRVREALELNPDTVCVSCPYCLTMFEDGLKDVKCDSVKVRDIAEVVAEALFMKR